MESFKSFTAAHWGIYEVDIEPGAESPRLRPFSRDPDPSPIGLDQLDPAVTRVRVRAPVVRASWLERGPGASPERRGREPFVEVDWDTALDLVEAELSRVRPRFGNTGIFGGSYGWSSAGRFHHAVGQLHRFLNLLGGYVRSVDSYSLGAGRALMPHVVTDMDDSNASHTSWSVVAEHTDRSERVGGYSKVGHSDASWIDDPEAVAEAYLCSQTSFSSHRRHVPRYARRMPDLTRISPQEALEKMKQGYAYVDVRSEPEFADGHPEGAVNVPIMHVGAGGMTPNPDFLNVMSASFGKDAKIVVGCKAGGRSLRAARALVAQGYTDVLDQRAGWDGARDSFGQMSEPGWSRAGLPSEKGAPEGRGYSDMQKKAAP